MCPSAKVGLTVAARQDCGEPRPLGRGWSGSLRANIDETVLLVVITEQGENRNQCEEQRNLFGFPHGGRRCRLRFPWGGPRFLLSAASGLGTASIAGGNG